MDELMTRQAINTIYGETKSTKVYYICKIMHNGRSMNPISRRSMKSAITYAYRMITKFYGDEITIEVGHTYVKFGQEILGQDFILDTKYNGKEWNLV